MPIIQRPFENKVGEIKCSFILFLTHVTFPCLTFTMKGSDKYFESFCHGFAIVSKNFISRWDIGFGTSVIMLLYLWTSAKNSKIFNLKVTNSIFWCKSSFLTSTQLDWFNKLNVVLIGTSSDMFPTPPKFSILQTREQFNSGRRCS